MNLNRDIKRAISYSLLTIILFIIASIYDIGNEESLVAYAAGMMYLITGFLAIWFLTKSCHATVTNKI